MKSAPFTPLDAKERQFFPREWTYWADEIIPAYVKKHFLKEERHQDRPFNGKDASFFFKGIAELSDLFTTDRQIQAGRVEPYFLHPRFQSSYLLYFLPFQASKFFFLFEKHKEVLFRAIKAARNANRPFRVVDLASGPGTASFAFFLWMLKHARAFKTSPNIEWHWADTHPQILKHGSALFELLREKSKELATEFKLHTPLLRGRDALFSPSHFGKNFEPDLLLLGNVINELESGLEPKWNTWLNAMAPQGSVLFVEPASKRGGRSLSKMREHLLSSEEIPPFQIAGPCLHTGACPLLGGKDWCHFSAQVSVPGRWYKSFSQRLGSEREWLKFSYLWVSRDANIPKAEPGSIRVVSDPLTFAQKKMVLLCKPSSTAPERLEVGRMRLLRGDILLGDVIKPVPQAVQRSPIRPVKKIQIRFAPKKRRT